MPLAFDSRLLARAFRVVMHALLVEADRVDAALASRLRPVLIDVTTWSLRS